MRKMRHCKACSGDILLAAGVLPAELPATTAELAAMELPGAMLAGIELLKLVSMLPDPDIPIA